MYNENNMNRYDALRGNNAQSRGSLNRLREPSNLPEDNFHREADLHKFDQKRGSNSQKMVDDHDSSDGKEECDKRF